MKSCYKPKKQFFEMNIEELQEYVNHCKKIDKKTRRINRIKKSRSKRLRKTKKRKKKFTRRKKKT
ncbi:MAG: hypothetical protein CML42_09690 [Rhodobacteraceae bacterium]|nr:hypothetical protein [Paracoccaceae bacterium]|tara:strand:- start:13592 stop:13786 length:195 start_codon:yes stop_codon:yes gene_type:complete